MLRLVDAGTTPLPKAVRPVEVDGEWVADRAVETEHHRLEQLLAHELGVLLPDEHGPDHLTPRDQPGQMPLRHEEGVEGEARVQVEDGGSMSPLLDEFPEDMREQLGGRVHPEVLLNPPLLGKEVLPCCLDFSSLTEVPRADAVQPGGHGVDGELLRLQDPLHGVEVQLELS